MWPAAAWRLPRRRLLAGLDAEIALLLLERERHAAGGAHVAAGQALRAHRRAVELPAVVRRHARALELARHLRLVAALVGEALPLERHARVREALRLALEHPGAGAWGEFLRHCAADEDPRVSYIVMLIQQKPALRSHPLPEKRMNPGAIKIG